jgi:hypothetical protein
LTLFVPQAQVSNRTFTDDNDRPGSERIWLNRQAKLVGAFAVLCNFSMILIFFFVRETKLATASENHKQRRTLNYISLEELNKIFIVDTTKCWRYYINHVLLRSIHNVGYEVGIYEDRLHIEESMHFWSTKRLDRKKKQEEEAESEKTAQVEQVEEISVSASGALADEGTPRRRNVEYDARYRRAARSSDNNINPDLGPRHMSAEHEQTLASAAAPEPDYPDPPDQPHPNSFAAGLQSPDGRLNRFVRDIPNALDDDDIRRAG